MLLNVRIEVCIPRIHVNARWRGNLLVRNSRAQKAATWIPWSKMASENRHTGEFLVQLRGPALMNKMESKWARLWASTCMSTCTFVPHICTLSLTHKHTGMHTHQYKYTWKRKRKKGLITSPSSFSIYTSTVTGSKDENLSLKRFSTFLTPPFFPTVPHVAVTPTIKLFSLLPHNCNFITVVNHNVSTSVFWWS